jgi:Zinc carboxypeptidase
MARRFLILILIPVLTASRCFSQAVTNDDKLRRIISQYGQVEVTIPYIDKNSIDILTTNVSILSVKEKLIHVSLSPLTIDWFILQKYNYQIEEKAVARGVLSANSLTQAMDWDTYPTYTQYDSIMHSFLKLYPSLCHLDTIGTSVKGKLVLALRISGTESVDENKPAVFYTSTMHGDETGGFVLMLHLADYLLKNYSLDSRVKNMVDNLEIWINPLANPDGTYNNGDTINSPVRYNANGYDLNRNFPDPITPNTMKQKETLDMIKFMRKHKFVLSANFHTGSEVVNYPWDRWLSKIHADDSWFNAISRAYADTAHVYAGPEYMNFLDNGVTRGAVWYIVYGGRQDFMTWELHGREVTIELDDQYITPAPQLPLLWQNNWHSLLGYLENALYGIHGLVRDINTHSPLPARVFINGHDKDSSQVYSDTLTGKFIRFLSPGSWNLTFSAAGYRDTTVSTVVVSLQKTDLIIDMVQGVSDVEKTKTGNPLLLYPNPSTNTIHALPPDIITGNINVRIINQAGMIINEYNTEFIDGIPIVIDIKSLLAGTYTIVFTNTSTRASCHGRFVVIK